MPAMALRLRVLLLLVRVRVLRVLRVRMRLVRRLARSARCVAACLIAQRDEKRRHVFAVPVDLGKSRTSALRREPRRRELELNVVRLCLGAADVTARSRVADLDLIDRVPAHVVVTSKEGSGAEQAAQRSVVERGDRVRER